MNANQISITGRLTRDPEVRYTNSGKCICNFSIAHNKRIKVGDEWKDAPTTFLDCKAWGKQGEVVAATCRKGSMVQVTGSVETEEWEKNGEKKSKMVINAVCICAVLNNERPSDNLDFTPTQEKPAAASSGGFSAVSEVADDVPF